MKYRIEDQEIEIDVGDVVYGHDVYCFDSLTWIHKYTVKQIEQSERFGQPDVLLTVDIEAVDHLKQAPIRMIESNTKRWSGQLF